MTRIIAKLFAVTLVLTAFFRVAPVVAGPAVWVSGTGVDTNPCTATQPCATFTRAMDVLGGSVGGQINCLNSPQAVDGGFGLFDTISLTIDCAGVFETAASNFGALTFEGPNQSMKIRNLTISGFSGGYPAVTVTGSGALIIENCVFENFNARGAGPALQIEPTGPLNLVIKNTRVSSNAAAGVLIKPAAGGSVTGTFDGVTITNNAGGLRTDTTNGAVTVDISNSTISNNANNGLIAIGGAGGQNMVSVRNDVIASNSQAGIEASGGNAAVLVNNTLLDSNTGGALSAVSSGRILTYQNNNIVGSPGTGFTGTAAPQ
jgi:Right handed beta helix region